MIACTDSINLTSQDFEQMLNAEGFVIEDVKTVSQFNPIRWRDEFGSKLTRNIKEAKIVHAENGATIPLKRFINAPKMQIIEFAGINGYKERSSLLRAIFDDLYELLEDCNISRIDISIDFDSIPKKVISKLCETRIPFAFKNTTYFKTAKESKKNQVVDIKFYDKTKADKLNFVCYRLEFVFKARYLKNQKLNEINLVLKKIEKSILKFTNLKVKISPLSRVS